MQYMQCGNEIELIGVKDFELEKTFECGQCFRWNADETGAYTGVAFGKAARIRRDGESIFITGTVNEFENIWYDYFDLKADYSKIRQELCVDEYMKKAAEFGSGIRILHQDKWETLCSFIISQCNNIPRIKKIIETFCSLFGERIIFEGKTFYSFPVAEKIASLTEDELVPLHCGYRAPYIIEAAKAVASGELNLEELSHKSALEAGNELKKINGIGDKVANCVILFALNILDAFPVDVWMKKAIKMHYGEGFDPKMFGGYAGVAQQYMFYYQRSGKC